MSCQNFDVLIVGGGIAAYKACELVRLATKGGAEVRVVMTANAARFVGPLTFETLTGHPVMLDTFQGGEGGTSLTWHGVALRLRKWKRAIGHRRTETAAAPYRTVWSARRS